MVTCFLHPLSGGSFNYFQVLYLDTRVKGLTLANTHAHLHVLAVRFKVAALQVAQDVPLPADLALLLIDCGLHTYSNV